MQARLIHIAFRTIRFLLGLLPTDAVLKCSAAIGKRIGGSHLRDVEVAKAQIKLAFPDKTQAEIDQLVAEMFSHFGRSVGESLMMDKIIKNSEFQTTDDLEDLLKNNISSAQTICLLSSHHGNFELLGAYLQTRGLNLSVFARKPNFSYLIDLVRMLRETYGVKILWRDDPKVSFQILRLIKEKTSFVVLLDQDVDLSGDFSEFFGVLANTPTALVRFATKYHIPVYACFLVRVGKHKHKFVFEKIDYQNDSEAEILRAINNYNRILESSIRNYPAQWPWWHRRWRRRPEIDYRKNPDELFSRKQYLAWLKEQIEIKENETKSAL